MMYQKGSSRTLAQETASEMKPYSQYMKPYSPYSDESDIEPYNQQAIERWKHSNDASINTKYDITKQKPKTNLSSQTKNTVLNSSFYDEISDYVTDDVKSSTTSHTSDEHEAHSPTPGAAALQKQIDSYHKYLTNEVSHVEKPSETRSPQKIPLMKKNDNSNQNSKHREKSKMHQDTAKAKKTRSLYSYNLRRQPTLFSIASPDEQSQPGQSFSDNDYLPEAVQEELTYTEKATNSNAMDDDTFEGVQDEPVDTINTTVTVKEDIPEDHQGRTMIENTTSTIVYPSQLSDNVTQATHHEAQTTTNSTPTAQADSNQSTGHKANPSITDIVNNQHESVTNGNVNSELSQLLQDKHSPLAAADLKKLIPQVLKKLPEKQRNDLCSYLPPPDVASGKITQDFIKHGNTIFWESAILWQQFLSAGSFNPSRKRKQRKEDTESPFKDDQYEEYWGAKIENARKKRTKSSKRNK